jgi:hypothetical protein
MANDLQYKVRVREKRREKAGQQEEKSRKEAERRDEKRRAMSGAEAPTGVVELAGHSEKDWLGCIVPLPGVDRVATASNKVKVLASRSRPARWSMSSTRTRLILSNVLRPRSAATSSCRAGQLMARL